MDSGLPNATQKAPPPSGVKPLGSMASGARPGNSPGSFDALLATLGLQANPNELPTQGVVAKPLSNAGQPKPSEASDADVVDRLTSEPAIEDSVDDRLAGSTDPTVGAQLLASLQVALPTKADQAILVPREPDSDANSDSRLDPSAAMAIQDLSQHTDEGSKAFDAVGGLVGASTPGAPTTLLASATELNRGAPPSRDPPPQATYAPPNAVNSAQTTPPALQASVALSTNVKSLPESVAVADSAARGRNPSRASSTGLGPSSVTSGASLQSSQSSSQPVVTATTNVTQSDSDPAPEDRLLSTNPEADKISAETGADRNSAPPVFSPTSGVSQANTIAVRAGPETVTNLAAHIVRNLEGRATRFDVELHPADLGRVDVRLEIGAHGRLKASMSFENPQAAADMRGRSEELQRALENAGFDLSGGLNFDVAGDRGRGQNSRSDEPSNLPTGAQGRAFDAALSLADGAADSMHAAALSKLQVRRVAGLDIRI
jgi:flagellar hook-length control protein FliK